MASYTKFYLTRTSGSNFGATRGLWQGGSSSTNQLRPDKRGDNVPGAFGANEGSASATFTVLNQVLTSVPLAAQTISGTFDLVVGVLESAADANFYWRVHAWVLNPNGASFDDSNLRGTLIDQYEENTTNEWPTTAQGVGLQAPVTMTPVVVNDGDFLIVELGFVARNTLTSTRTGYINTGAVSDAPPSGTPLADLTIGSTSVLTQAGYVVFSNPIDVSTAVPTNIDCASADTTALAIFPAIVTVSDTSQIPSDGVLPTGGLGAGSELYNPVWYEFVAPSSGTIRVDSFPYPEFGNYSTALTAYTGACGALTQVAYNSGLNGHGGVFTLAVTSGVTYKLRIASRFEGGGQLKFTVRYVTVPANDDFANREVIASLPYSTMGDTTLATVEGSEQVGAEYAFFGAGHNKSSVWFEYTPAVDEIVRVNTAGSVMESVTVWTGSALGSLTEVAGSTYHTFLNGGGEQDFDDAVNMVFALSAGVAYKIQLSSYYLIESPAHNMGASAFTLNVSVVPFPKSNTSPATASPFTSPLSVDFTDVPDYQFATPLMSGVDPLDDQGKALWYTWTSDVSGPIDVKPASTFANPVDMAVFSGAVGSLVQVAQRLSARLVTEKLSWTATLGVTYHIQVLSENRVEFIAPLVLAGGTAPPPPSTASYHIEAAIGCQMRFSVSDQAYSFISEQQPQLKVSCSGGPLIDVHATSWFYMAASHLVLDVGWEFTIRLSGVPFTVLSTNLLTPVTAKIVRPWVDPAVGIDDLDPSWIGKGPQVDPYRKYVVLVRTSTYHEDTLAYDADGFASFSIDGAVVWSVSDVQIKVKPAGGASDTALSIHFPMLGDTDNVWAATRATNPTYDGPEEIPQHPQMLKLDTFDTGIDMTFWTPTSRNPFATPTDPVWDPTNGINGSGSAGKGFWNIEGIYKSYSSTTRILRPPPVLDVPTPCCCDHQTSGNGRPTTPPGSTGPIDVPVLPAWTPVCTGGGVVPTQADLADVESWV